MRSAVFRIGAARAGGRPCPPGPHWPRSQLDKAKEEAACRKRRAVRSGVQQGRRQGPGRVLHERRRHDRPGGPSDQGPQGHRADLSRRNSPTRRAAKLYIRITSFDVVNRGPRPRGRPDRGRAGGRRAAVRGSLLRRPCQARRQVASGKRPEAIAVAEQHRTSGRPGLPDRRLDRGRSQGRLVQGVVLMGREPELHPEHVRRDDERRFGCERDAVDRL